MHAFEKTMIARMGFSDPDRRDPLHDLACQYLMLPNIVTRLAKHIGIHETSVEQSSDWGVDEFRWLLTRTMIAHQAQTEWVISKGYGEYRTTIGFADVLLAFTVQEVDTNTVMRKRVRHEDNSYVWTEWSRREDASRKKEFRCGVEVKIAPVPIGDLVRQIKLYRSYGGGDFWIAATAYDLTRAAVDTLRNENIHHVRLGPGFQEFVASRESESVADAEVI